MIEQIERSVSEAAERVERQRGLLASLRRRGHNGAANAAESLLATFEITLAQHRDRLETERRKLEANDALAQGRGE